jgi:hypothetical protein
MSARSWSSVEVLTTAIRLLGNKVLATWPKAVPRFKPWLVRFCESHSMTSKWAREQGRFSLYVVPGMARDGVNRNIVPGKARLLGGGSSGPFVARSVTSLSRRFLQVKKDRPLALSRSFFRSIAAAAIVSDHPGIPMPVPRPSPINDPSRGCRRRTANDVPCCRPLPDPNRQRRSRFALVAG